MTRRRFLQGAAGAGAALVVAGRTGSAIAQARPGGRSRPIRLPDGFDYPLAPGSRPPFCHGVASGDPLADRVVIWTRLTVPGWRGPRATVQWRVATDPSMRRAVAGGVVRTDASRDWTVKVDVCGLRPGRQYFYEFRVAGHRSPVGRTRTAPRLRQGIGVAVVSCSSYWSGYWNAYARIAERTDVDLVVHCGDHIYDFPDPAEWVRARNDRFDPAYVDFREWTGLDEVRRRYALHYADPDLVVAHAAHPFTIAWDNHDTDDGNGPTTAACRQAFWEWTPCRPPVPGRDRGGNLIALDPSRDHRRIRYGEVDLFVLDLRTRQDATTILGADQRRWFEAGLVDSTGRGAPWRLVVNPMPIAQVGLPGKAYGGWTDRPGDQASMLRYLADQGIDDTIFLAGDAHGAFLADLAPDSATYDRDTGAGSVGVEILANSISRGGADESLAETLYRLQHGGADPAADRAGYLPLLDQAQSVIRGIEGTLLDKNPTLKFAQWRDHGYGIVRLSEAEATLEQWSVPHLEVSGDQRLDARFRVGRGTNHAVPTPLP